MVKDKNTLADPKKRRMAAGKHPAADIGKTVGILACVTVLGCLFEWFGFAEANIMTLYVLAVLVISVVTSSRFYSLTASFVGVLIFNFLFTHPRFTLRAYDKGYPVTFLVMFAAAFLTGSLAAKLQSNARQSARSAFRMRILFDTNQLLQQAQAREEIFTSTVNQLMKLLNRDIVLYEVYKEKLKEPVFFPAGEGKDGEKQLSPYDHKAVEWVMQNARHAGATTRTFPEAEYLYLAIRLHDTVYGIVGIAVGSDPPDEFENSIILAVLGECALALENRKNAREKEEAAIHAKNEQLRADLLRMISHDLRTPLTSISGNASNLLYNGDSFDPETKKKVYRDIYDDSMWLINLVENLLSVTRLVEGRLNLHLTAELVDEAVKEAVRHVSRMKCEHPIRVENEDDLLLARMDAKLIVQVLINLIDNAVKYTPPGSAICIRTGRKENWAVISIEDEGQGIPDEKKEKVFEMFYSGANRIVDSRRSLGLGLSLCRSIVQAHGGSIIVTDRKPHGAVFTFTLPVEEVTLHE